MPLCFGFRGVVAPLRESMPFVFRFSQEFLQPLTLRLCKQLCSSACLNNPSGFKVNGLIADPFCQPQVVGYQNDCQLF